MKRKLEDIKEFKIERKIFDERTLKAIFKLMSKGYFKTVESSVREGKESVVLSAKDKDGMWLSLKVYKVEYCDFKNMWKYIVNDPRFRHVKKDRWSVVLNWVRREFKNLNTAFENGVSCPKPVTVNKNVLVEEFIGKDGASAPRLIDVEVKNIQDVYVYIVEEMVKMARAGLIHADLSAYNIVIRDKPYLIDFSQAVTVEHPLAKDFLIRDVKNINSYFAKLGVKINENLFDELSKMMKL